MPSARERIRRLKQLTAVDRAMTKPRRLMGCPPCRKSTSVHVLSSAFWAETICGRRHLPHPTAVNQRGAERQCLVWRHLLPQALVEPRSPSGAIGPEHREVSGNFTRSSNIAIKAERNPWRILGKRHNSPMAALDSRREHRNCSAHRAITDRFRVEKHGIERQVISTKCRRIGNDIGSTIRRKSVQVHSIHVFRPPGMN